LEAGAHSKAVGHAVNRRLCLFPRSNAVRGRYRPGLASRSSPSVASRAKGGGRSVRLAKHTPAICALKRRFCDNGTKLCPPAASCYKPINRPPHAPPAIELSFNLNLLPPTSLEARKSSSRTKKKVAKRVAAKKRAAPKCLAFGVGWLPFLPRAQWESARL
jgi:hypothetical protein